MRNYVAVFGGMGVYLWLVTSQVLAGGGGQNMLLLVNSNDENSLRIANAYAQARSIPSGNIIYTQPPTAGSGVPNYAYNDVDFTNTVYKPIQNRLTTLGSAAGQIDYIDAIGLPYTVVKSLFGTQYSLSTSYVLNRLDTWGANLNSSGQISYMGFVGLQNQLSPLYAFYNGKVSNGPWTPYTQGANTAIHHSDTYAPVTINTLMTPSGTYNGYSVATAGEYVGGMLAYTGFLGNSPGQAIANLQRTVSGDGTKPVGTVYFEQNSNIRTTARSWEWPAAQAGLTARGIPYVQELNTPGATPQNRSAGRGAVVGSEWPVTPNGSTYLPGSWADNLTSYGAGFNSPYQNKLTGFLAAGAGASSGTVVEPYANALRFPDAQIHNVSADGSTLGEAYYKSVADGQLTLLVGDSLSQAYADVPKVSITSGPTQGQTISGGISVGASSAVTPSATTTGVAQLQLYVDGKLNQTITSGGGGGTFNLDTTTLTDGQHELRVVAINNSTAQSQGYTLRDVMVNNHGQSVNITAGDQTLSASQVASIPVSATLGGASLSRIDLRSLGRTVGSTSSPSGNINLDASQLAYGSNTVIPVAVLSDGSEVAGNPINVTRNPNYLAGQTPTPLAARTAGVKAEYFYNKGGTSIAASDFSGTPNLTATQGKIVLQGGSGTALGYPLAPEQMASTTAGASIDKLAVRLSGHFNVDVSQAGEFQFFLYNSNDSAQLSIDGQKLMGFDNQQWFTTTQWGSSVFLSPGEHSLELLAANTIDPNNQPNNFDLCLYYRGADGVSNLVDNSFLYQAPEPSSLAILTVAGGWLSRRRRK